MALFDHEFATSKQQKPRSAAWPKCLGTACAVALLAFLVLGIGVMASASLATAIGLVGICLAAVIACAGGYVYFFYERDE